jgi:hypothetical protein
MKNTSLVIADTNVLFRNMDNWIKISGISTKVNLISKNGNSISSYDSNRFMVIPRTLKPDTLMIHVGKKLLLKRLFSIDTLPKLTIQLGNIQNDTATVSEVLANKGLRAIFKGSLYYFPIRIVSFRTTFIGPGADTLNTNAKSEGNMLSKEQESIIKQLKTNSKILFHEIRAVTPNSKPRELYPFSITIK